MLRNIPGLCPLDASNTPNPGCDQDLQTLHVPPGGQSPVLRTTLSEGPVSWGHSSLNPALPLLALLIPRGLHTSCHFWMPHPLPKSLQNVPPHPSVSPSPRVTPGDSFFRDHGDHRTPGPNMKRDLDDECKPRPSWADGHVVIRLFSQGKEALVCVSRAWQRDLPMSHLTSK